MQLKIHPDAEEEFSGVRLGTMITAWASVTTCLFWLSRTAVGVHRIGSNEPYSEHHGRLFPSSFLR